MCVTDSLAALRMSLCRHGKDNGTYIGPEGHSENIMPPLRAMLRIAFGSNIVYQQIISVKYSIDDNVNLFTRQAQQQKNNLSKKQLIVIKMNKTKC